MALESGSRLGSYEITDQLGKGGMGEVYRARDTKLGREVAIKVLPSEFAQDAERLARLEREARMLAALNHPNIGAIYGLEQSDETRFLVLELVEGETLADRLKRGTIPVQESLKLALQIAEALEAAHDKGVIHRDLKPANIKVTPDGKIKVLDFGLAKAFVGDQADVNLSNSPTLSIAATQAGVILGTAAYMSPEQASGEVADHRTDVWAFGVVLFEMLSGRQVFTGKTAAHVMGAVLEREPDWSSLPLNLQPLVRDALQRCLEKEAKNRRQAIADVRFDLQKVLADPGGVTVKPVAEVGHATPQSKLLWVTAIVLASAITGLAVWYLTPDPPPREPTRFLISGTPSVPPVALGDPYTSLAISPDGRDIVYNLDLNGGFYRRPVDLLEGRALDAGERMDLPFFSPDGEWIGFGSTADSSLKRMSIQGGPAETITTWQGYALRGATWGTGDIIFSSANVPGLMRVPAVGGDPEVITAPASGELHFWPSILPNSRAVLFTVITAVGTPRIGMKNLETGEESILIPVGSRPVYAESGHIVYAVEDTLRAVPFDIDQLRVLGDPVPVLEGVATNTIGAAQFSIALDGSLVYVSGGLLPDATGLQQNLNLTIFDNNGNRTPSGAPPRPYRSPRVSPDGTQVAVEVLESSQNSLQASIWVYDIGSGAAIRRLTQVTDGNSTRPIWTPDGERLTFASDREGPYSIYWQPADGSGPAERLTTADEGTTHRPDSWSPEGVLSFEVRQGPGVVGGVLGDPTSGELWTRNAEGDIELFYDLPELHQFGSSFSPDGRWLAYTSAESLPSVPGTFRVFVGAYPGNTPRFEIEGDGASWPVWSPDGNELFYRLSTGEGRVPTLNSVNIATDPTFQFTTEESLFVEGFNIFTDYRDFDPLPDGRGFLMLTVADAPTDSGNEDGEVEPQPGPQVILVQDFFEELKRLVPVP